MSELKAYTFSNMEGRGLAEYYLKSEADKMISKLKADNERLTRATDVYQDSISVHKGRCTELSMKLCERHNENKRLKRALYKACANWALSTLAWLDCIDQGEPRKWSEMRQKCLKKVEEFKEQTR